MPMFSQEDVNRQIAQIRWGEGRPGYPQPAKPRRVTNEQARAAMGGYVPGQTPGGVTATPPPRQDAPYSPTTMVTEPGGFATPTTLADALGQYQNFVEARAARRGAREARRTAKGAKVEARRALRQARRGPAPLGTTKAADIASAKAAVASARKEYRGTKKEARKARRAVQMARKTLPRTIELD